LLFEISNFSVSSEKKEIIRNISLKVNEGEVHVLMGPNGSGKSSLCYGIMGHPKYKTSGSIRLNGKELGEASTDERAKNGLFLAFQHPQEIHGVNVVNISRKAILGEDKKNFDAILKINEDAAKFAKEVGLPEELIKRDLNVGFSGGEKKRAEILQMKLLNPKIIILDEIDSGLDIDGLKTVAEAINSMRDGKHAFIMITHFPRILKYVKPDHVHVISKGKIAASGKHELALQIEKEGYEKLLSKE
jgi:Fe-S cluster assembly ATP-binding protein